MTTPRSGQHATRLPPVPDRRSAGEPATVAPTPRVRDHCHGVAALRASIRRPVLGHDHQRVDDVRTDCPSTQLGRGLGRPSRQHQVRQDRGRHFGQHTPTPRGQDSREFSFGRPAADRTTAAHDERAIGTPRSRRPSASVAIAIRSRRPRGPLGIPPFRGGMVYEETPCQRYGGSTTRSSGRGR
jgi:hypothetical protein